jgi:hypothetical protein
MADSELENSCMKTHRQTLKILGACAVAVAAAACGSSGPSSSNSPTGAPATTQPTVTPSATSTTTGSASGDTAAIKANWTKFFDFKTATSQQVALLQNGSQFTSAINNMKSSPLAAGANAKVLSVSNVTATQATVKYDVLLGTTVALPNQTGTAVFQDGTWKVGDGSLCGLLSLELKKSQLPAACSSAG